MSATAKSRGPELVAVAGLFLALSWIFTILRFYARAIIVRQIGSDDYLAFAAQIGFTMMCVSCFVGVTYGIGRKGMDIPGVLEGGAVQAVLWWWMSELWYLLASLILKLSMGIFLLRIATSRSIRFSIFAILLATLAATGFFFFHFMFQCKPLHFFWTRLDFGHSGPGGEAAVGSCVSEDDILKSAYAYSAITCAVDFSLCVLPVWMVGKLQINKRTKMSVMAVLSLWCLASVTTFIRIPYLSGLKGDKLNFLYNTADIGIWSLCECGISIMCIAAATLRPLFAKSFFRSSAASQNDTQTGTGGWRTGGGTGVHSRSMSRGGWGPGGGSGGMGGTPRGMGYIRSGSGSKNLTIDEEIGAAMGSDSDSIEMKRPRLAVMRSPSQVHDGSGSGRHKHAASYNEAMGLGTTTYVSAHQPQRMGSGGIGEAKSVDEEEKTEADFVYGYGIRRTTVVTTQRE